MRSKPLKLICYTTNVNCVFKHVSSNSPILTLNDLLQTSRSQQLLWMCDLCLTWMCVGWLPHHPPSQNLNQKWSGIWIWIFTLIRIRIRTPVRSQNVSDSLTSRRQSFRQVSRKSAGDYVRNANKSAKIPYSAIVKEVGKWSGTS